MVDTERHVAVVVTEERFEAAAERAVRIMRELLAARLNVSREEAYALVGLSGDLRISQNVNPYGVTLRLEVPKSVWDGSRLEPLGAHPLHSDPDKPTS
jgi:acetamidase/formamidase